MSNNNMKFFDALVSKTKVYLVIIAILLLLICMLKPICIIPSIIIYAIIVVYTLWTDNKRKAELSERIKELNFNVDKVSKRSLINSPFPLIMAETNGNIIWKNAKFVQEFNNFDINKYLARLLKEIKLEIENNEKIKDNKVITNIVIEKRKYKVIGEYIKTKSNDKKEEIWFSMISKDASKGTALEKLANYLSIPIQNTIAIGNDNNDLSMIKVAGIGVAVSNATIDLKNNADKIIDSNDEDGIAKYLSEIFL